MNAAAQHLITHGIRPSVQRMAIMEYLMEHATHPTVDMIYQDLMKTMPTLSRTTIYNTLTLLEEKDALTAINIDSKNVRYDGDTSPHAHFMCRSCGMIYDIPISSAEAHIEKMPPRFRVERVKLYYTGLCEKCQKIELANNRLRNSNKN